MTILLSAAGIKSSDGFLCLMLKSIYKIILVVKFNFVKNVMNLQEFQVECLNENFFDFTFLKLMNILMNFNQGSYYLI